MTRLRSSNSKSAKRSAVLAYTLTDSEREFMDGTFQKYVVLLFSYYEMQIPSMINNCLP